MIDNFMQGCFDSLGEDAMPVTQKMSELALKLSPDMKDVLILGLGAGSIVKNIEKKLSPRFDIIEINPAVLKIAKNLGFKEEPNKNIRIDDARNFLRQARQIQKKYDLIFLDAYPGGSFSPPWQLFSFEAFSLLKDLLKPNGILIINTLGRLEQNDKLTASLSYTLSAVFEKTFYYPLLNEGAGVNNIILLASRNLEGRGELKSAKNLLFGGKSEVLLSDDKNSLELLGISNYSLSRGQQKENFGLDFLAH